MHFCTSTHSTFELPGDQQTLKIPPPCLTSPCLLCLPVCSYFLMLNSPESSRRKPRTAPPLGP